MKNFTFQFESILAAKQQQLQLAEGELSHQLRLLRQAEEQVGVAEHRLEEACEEFAKGMRTPMLVGRYHQAEEMIQALQTQRDAARQQAQSQREVWLANVEKCKRLGAEVEGLSTLRVEAKREYQKDLERHAQAQLDEFVIRSWSR